MKILGADYTIPTPARLREGFWEALTWTVIVAALWFANRIDDNFFPIPVIAPTIATMVIVRLFLEDRKTQAPGGWILPVLLGAAVGYGLMAAGVR